jgi:type IX secretion system PorP/SprF family membrane protein
MKLIILIISIVAISAFKAEAQDPVFSQYYNAPVYLNPALVGDEDEMLINFNYRSQWSALHQPYSTAQTSFIYPFYRDIDKQPVSQLGGLGVSIFNDIAGVNREFRTIGGSASFAYNLPLNRQNQISFGIKTSVINVRIDGSDSQWGSQYIPGVGFNPGDNPADQQNFENKTVLSLTPGAFWRYRTKNNSDLIQTAFSGLAVEHLNAPNAANLDGQTDRMPLVYKYHGGMVFGINEQFNLSANVLTLFSDKLNQTNVGAFLSYLLASQGQGLLSNSILRLGTWHRWDDSFILSTEFITNRFQVGFSYDWNVTSLNNFQGGVGAYEVSLGLRFNRIAPPKVRY